ncbi:peroxiredoxin family protein [Gaopeijia maritima]|uniref:TlpA disulfide reductase family protein n=1 Tax=Gaopeijia maritima TaxID=3119007 RepID=A0ABU9E701_9BACT
MSASATRPWLIALLVGLTGVTALAGVLMMRNSELRTTTEDLMERSRFAHPGAYVPEFEAPLVGGDAVRVGTLGAPTDGQLLFFFNTTCEYCRASIPSINALARRADMAVIGVSLDSLHLAEMYVHDHDVTYPVAALTERRIAELYRVRAVPMVILVDGYGRVAYARRGVLEGSAPLDSILDAVRTLRAREPESAAVALDAGSS